MRFPVLILAGVLLAASAALAHEGATGIVKQRMEAMKDIAASMKVVGTMVKGETAFDRDAVGEAARTIKGHAEAMPAQFPDGSTQHPSEALPAIWRDWDAFTAIAARLAEHAGALADEAAAAESIDALKARFGEVAQTCKACHQDFRVKQQ